MESYPAPEALTLPRHLASKRVRVLMTLSTLAEIRNQVSDHDASDSERAASVFTLAVDVMQAGRHRRVHANGRDIYGLTAPIVGLAVDRLVAAEGLRGGVLAASQVVQPADMLAALKPWGLTVDDAVAIAER